MKYFQRFTVQIEQCDIERILGMKYNIVTDNVSPQLTVLGELKVTVLISSSSFYTCSGLTTARNYCLKKCAKMSVGKPYQYIILSASRRLGTGALVHKNPVRPLLFTSTTCQLHGQHSALQRPKRHQSAPNAHLLSGRSQDNTHLPLPVVNQEKSRFK